jgi:hypothetical protein
MASAGSFAKVLPFVGIAIGGGFLLWAVLDAKSAGQAYRKGRKVIEDTTGARLARPDMAVRGPVTEDEFAVLAEAMEVAILELCAESGKRGMPPLMATSTGFADEVTRRTLSALYPEFPWPAITGDHASTLELQGLLRYLVLSGDREAMCGQPDDTAEADEVDEADDAEDDELVPAPDGLNGFDDDDEIEPAPMA